jgi:hypothetical protein
VGVSFGIWEVGIKVPADRSDVHITVSAGWSLEQADNVVKMVLETFKRKLWPITFGYEPRPEVMPEAGFEVEGAIGVGEVGILGGEQIFQEKPGVEIGHKGVGIAGEYTSPGIIQEYIKPTIEATKETVLSALEALQEYIEDQYRPNPRGF